MIAILIAYEFVTRFFDPVPIHFEEAIPIAFLGLAVNIASAWLLSGADHGHSYGHAHGVGEGHHHDDQEEMRRIATNSGVAVLEIFEDEICPALSLARRTWIVAYCREQRDLDHSPGWNTPAFRPDGSRRLSGID